MSVPQAFIANSHLTQSQKEDLILLYPHLSVIEQLRVKKSIEIGAEHLLKIVFFKYKQLIKQLHNPQSNEAEQKLLLENDEKQKEQPTSSRNKVIHKEYAFSTFSWSNLVDQIEQLRPNNLAVTSLLKDVNYLGLGVQPLEQNTSSVPMLDSIENLSDYRQLGQLDSLHVNFLLDDNPDQKILEMEKHLQIACKKLSTPQLRALFVVFLRSPLFYKYTFTGLTALNIKTDIPRKTLLNVLHQNDDRFLNSSQFEWSAKIVRTLRSLCVL